MQDRHSAWFEAAESPPVYFGQHLNVFLQDILTQRIFSPILKQMEVTRILDFATICKFEFWSTAITLGDTEYVSETILKVLCAKFWNGAPEAKNKNERGRAETLTDEPMSRARSVASKCYLTKGFKIYGSWWILKKTYSPVLVFSFLLHSLEL